ncbi:MAG: Lrp/AsnC family transcriptional regulator [Thermoplasmatota archaeon]
MSKNASNGNKEGLNSRLLAAFLKDPTRSMRELAKELDSYRQTIWRKKKRMEEENIIWGYTAVIDEAKLGKGTFLVLMKMKPMIEGLADIMVKRIKRNEPGKMNIRLIDAFQVNGEYDWIIRFSAPDHTTARTYFDTLRAVYADHLLEKPVMVDVNFVLVAEGKTNPEIDRLFDLVISA